MILEGKKRYLKDKTKEGIIIEFNKSETKEQTSLFMYEMFEKFIAGKLYCFFYTFL